MFLAESQIQKELADGRLLGEGANPDYIKQASYDLRLGSDVYITGETAPRTLSLEEPYVSLPPGQFALLTTYESVDIPDNRLGFIALRNSFKTQGLVNISGFHVDPTYRGKLLFAVQNVGPNDIRLKYMEPTFIIFFAMLSGEVKETRDQQKDTHFKGLKGIRLQDMQSFGGSTVTIAKLQREIEQLRTMIFIYVPILVTIVVALVQTFWPSHSK